MKYFKENFKGNGFFRCKRENRFITHNQICDGIVDCLLGSDEISCQGPKINHPSCKLLSFYTVKCNSLNYSSFSNQWNKDFIVKNVEYAKKLIINGEIPEINNLKNSTSIVHFQIENSKKFFYKPRNFPNLIYLSIKNCNLTINNLMIKNPFKMLITLILSNNPLDSIRFLSFCFCSRLKYIDLSFTKITHLYHTNFINLNNLEILIMKNTKIKKIGDNFFPKNSKLKSLIMIYIGNLRYKNADWVKNLKNIQSISSDNFYLCCFIKKIIRKNINCKMYNRNFEMCSFLIDSQLIKFIYWLLGFVGLTGNIISILLVSFSKTFSKIFKLSLCFSDFMTSLYILSIGCADSYFKDNYAKNDEFWRGHRACKALGVILSFSFIMSTGSLFFITIERFFSVYDPLRKKNILTYPRTIIAIQFTISLIISIFPVYVGVSKNNNINYNFRQKKKFKFKFFFSSLIYVSFFFKGKNKIFIMF